MSIVGRHLFPSFEPVLLKDVKYNFSPPTPQITQQLL